MSAVVAHAFNCRTPEAGEANLCEFKASMVYLLNSFRPVRVAE